MISQREILWEYRLSDWLRGLSRAIQNHLHHVPLYFLGILIFLSKCQKNRILSYEEKVYKRWCDERSGTKESTDRKRTHNSTQTISDLDNRIIVIELRVCNTRAYITHTCLGSPILFEWELSYVLYMSIQKYISFNSNMHTHVYPFPIVECACK